jgi:hypothetical protein
MFTGAVPIALNILDVKKFSVKLGNLLGEYN